MPALPRPVDLSAYPAGSLQHGWFLQADVAETASPGQDTLALASQVTSGHYPLRAQSSFARAKADFERARAAKRGSSTQSNMPIVGALIRKGVAEAAAGNAGGGMITQQKFKHVVCQKIANIIPQPGLPSLLMQAFVSVNPIPVLPFLRTFHT